MTEIVERRRSPRVELNRQKTIRLEMRSRVHLLDISHAGVLMASEARLPVGIRGFLRTELAARSFKTELTVQRNVKGAHGGSAAGAQFVAMDDRSREHLERFLRRAVD